MSTNKPWTRQKLTQMLYHAFIGSLADNAIEIGWVLCFSLLADKGLVERITVLFGVNDAFWVVLSSTYYTARTSMTATDLTPEQEEALFPEVPDYFIIDGKVYKPTIADHVEYYGRKVDECSYYRITLNETTDSDTLNEVNEQLRKEGREELKQHTEAWLNKLRKTHPWIEENRLVLRVQYEDGQIDNACITMNSKVIALMDKEHPDTTDVEDWLNQLAQ